MDCFTWTCASAADGGSPLAGQEYLQSLLRSHRFDVDRLLEVPEGYDRFAWLYEHMRQICIELGWYLVEVQKECTEKVCPVMKANETTYYCAGHGHPRPCSAIGYAVHTLDYAIRQLNNQVSFPSRTRVPETSMKHFQSMARRIYRIFSHTYFHHREIFETQETATYLYARFVKLSRKYELTPESLIIITDLPTTV
ncbi:hypothetical protein GGI12_003894 [Dipsacomyces acuminosporus]|nr:hypothetical protein GGI12_003894 [Dipsacomyces acuminosporus]